MEIKEKIIQKLQEVVKELTKEDVEIQLSIPKDDGHGDYTSNIAMRLAKQLGKNPLEIAQQIADDLGFKMQDLGIDKVEAVAPGFINVYLSSDALVTNAKEVLNDFEKVALTDKMKDKKVVIEFTDPNPFKEFHIGHVYTNIVGESLSRIYEANGAIVHRGDYFGDVGMHVAKALWGLKNMLQEDKISMKDLAEKPLNDRINYFGKAYAKGSTAYEEDTKAQEEMKHLNRLVYIAAQKMWQKEKGITALVDYQKDQVIDEKELDEIYEMYRVGREWSLAYFDSLYERIGMQFAGYYPESIAGEKGYGLVKSHITDGVFVEHDGAVIFKGEEFGLHTRVFINSLGLPTYEAKELGLAVWKNEEFPYDFSIILTGNEINEYFKVLMKALSLIKPELAAKSKHIGHGMVRMASGKKMSSRTGQIISGKNVLDEAKNLAKKKIAEAKIGRESVSGDDADIVAEQVGVGAIKYSFLKSGIGKDIPFSFEESVSFEGNAGPYVQYTYTRTHSVLEKAGKHIQYPSDYMPQDEELKLLRHMQKFPEIVKEAALTYSPNVVTEYLFELAQIFNNFYQKYRILNASEEKEKTFRLALTATVGIILKQGLYLLGIQAPEKM